MKYNFRRTPIDTMHYDFLKNIFAYHYFDLSKYKNRFSWVNALNSGSVLNTGNMPLYAKMDRFAAITY